MVFQLACLYTAAEIPMEFRIIVVCECLRGMLSRRAKSAESFDAGGTRSIHPTFDESGLISSVHCVPPLRNTDVCPYESMRHTTAA